MEFSLAVVFWYGILHAFGPDHLSVIADFSIGKNRHKTLMITFCFAFGHGISLFLFAKILQSIEISNEILAYGDLISATVIILMGLYLLFMVFKNQIHLRKHIHNGQEHVHIWFGKSHKHSEKMSKTSPLTLGLLMGAGGVRGMLVTLGTVEGGTSFGLVIVFTLGVMLVFGLFGVVMLYINKNILTTTKSIRKTFAIAGVISLVVGLNIIIPNYVTGL